MKTYWQDELEIIPFKQVRWVSWDRSKGEVFLTVVMGDGGHDGNYCRINIEDADEFIRQYTVYLEGIEDREVCNEQSLCYISQCLQAMRG